MKWVRLFFSKLGFLIQKPWKLILAIKNDKRKLFPALVCAVLVIGGVSYYYAHNHKNTKTDNPTVFFYPASAGVDLSKKTTPQEGIKQILGMPRPKGSTQAAELDYGLANYYIQSKDYDKALPLLVSVSKVFSTNPFVWITLAQTQVAVSKQNDAKKSYDKAIGLMNQFDYPKDQMAAAKKARAAL